MRDGEEVLSFDQCRALGASKGRNALDRGVTPDGQMRHLAEQSIDQAVEKLVPASDVPIDRGDRYPELLGESAHREGVHPVEFDQPRRGVEDHLGADGLLGPFALGISDGSALRGCQGSHPQ